MYEKYWKLKESPFQNTLDTRFLYHSSEYEEAYARLNYCIEGRKGGAILIGEYGAGKSMLCEALLENLNNSHQYFPIYIFYPRLSPQEFLKEIFSQTRKISPPENIEALDLIHLLEKEVFYRSKDENRHPVVIVDEAHLIENIEVFEDLRLLLNFQSEGQFLLTLLFIGQPPLIEKINQLKQLKQRLAIRSRLNHLNKEEVSKYVTYRLSVAGNKEEIFSPSAIESISIHSKGIPREINNICDMALLAGFGKKSQRIDSKLVEEVSQDLEKVFT